MSEQSKMGADGLDVVGHRGIDPEGGEGFVGAKWPDAFGEACIVEPLCRLTDAKRLLAQLREELAQRDARIAELERLRGDGTTSDKYRAELYDEVFDKARSMGFGNVTMALAALESQQAASVGGEPTNWQLKGWNYCLETAAEAIRYLLKNGKPAAYGNSRYNEEHCLDIINALDVEIRERKTFFAALSPAGGGVAVRDAVNALLHQIDISDFVDSQGHSAKMLKPVHDLLALMAKPQVNSQEGEG